MYCPIVFLTHHFFVCSSGLLIYPPGKHIPRILSRIQRLADHADVVVDRETAACTAWLRNRGATQRPGELAVTLRVDASSVPLAAARANHLDRPVRAVPALAQGLVGGTGVSGW